MRQPAAATPKAVQDSPRTGRAARAQSTPPKARNQISTDWSTCTIRATRKKSWVGNRLPVPGALAATRSRAKSPASARAVTPRASQALARRRRPSSARMVAPAVVFAAKGSCTGLASILVWTPF